MAGNNKGVYDLREELTRFVGRRKHMPSYREFATGNRLDLYQMVLDNGGLVHWARELGIGVDRQTQAVATPERPRRRPASTTLVQAPRNPWPGGPPKPDTIPEETPTELPEATENRRPRSVFTKPSSPAPVTSGAAFARRAPAAPVDGETPAAVPVEPVAAPTAPRARPFRAARPPRDPFRR